MEPIGIDRLGEVNATLLTIELGGLNGRDDRFLVLGIGGPPVDIDGPLELSVAADGRRPAVPGLGFEVSRQAFRVEIGQGVLDPVTRVPGALTPALSMTSSEFTGSV